MVQLLRAELAAAEKASDRVALYKDFVEVQGRNRNPRGHPHVQGQASGGGDSTGASQGLECQIDGLRT